MPAEKSKKLSAFPESFISLALYHLVTILMILIFGNGIDYLLIHLIGSALIVGIFWYLRNQPMPFYVFLTVIWITLCLTFTQLYYLVPQINPHLYDDLFVHLDLVLFGNLYAALTSYHPPIVTEILQISYAAWLFLPFVFFIQLNRKTPQFVDRAMAVILWSFLICYFYYLILPGIGPRFTLFDFSQMSNDLPGLLFTPWIRSILGAGEHITGIANAASLVQRDLFPSAHTSVALAMIYLAQKYKPRWHTIITAISILAIIATIYLRYHYLIDDLFAALLSILIIVIFSGTFQDRK